MKAEDFLSDNVNASDFLAEESVKADDFLAENPVFRKKLAPRGDDPVFNAEAGLDEGRSPIVSALDFLTGHFPDTSKVKPEVQTVDGKLEINVPETAEVPFLQSPEMAIGAGATGAIKATGTLATKVLKGVEEAAGWATGGATDVAKAATKGATRVAENIVQPETLEAMVKGGSTKAMPKYAEGSSLNLERMDTTQDVLQFQNAMTKAAEKEIGKRRVSWNETVKAAEDLAWDEKEFLKQAKKKSFSAAEIHAARQINSNAMHDLFNTVRNMPADPLKRTDEMRLQVMDKINNYVEIMKATSQKSSEAGRALNIHKKMIAENPEFAADAYRKKVFDQMFDQMGGRELTDQMISDLSKIDFKDPKAVREILQKYHKAKVPDMFYEAWMNGLLSAPTTHFANILGNSLTIATKIPETAIAGMLKGKMPLREAQAETVGMLQGMKDGVRAAVKAFQTGVPSDMFAKVETSQLHAIPGKAGEVVRLPTRALTASDEFFKAIVYRAELNRQAFLIAEKEGLKGRAIGERMADILNGNDKAFKSIHEKAHHEALYRTFNAPLGRVGRTLMGARDVVPGFRYVVPFMRTPTNIAKFALERTPFNFAKIAHDYKTGKISPGQLSDELAKPVTGSLLAAATTIGVLDGNITGGPPKNNKERDLLYAKGWRPYSIKVGDTYYSYNRLEPLGSIMGMTADFVNESKSDAEINEKAGRIAFSFSRNIVSKTFMQGLSSVLDAVSDPGRYGGNWLEKTAGSVVPAAVGKAASGYDPYIRDVQTPWDAIQARIPGYSTKLPYKPGVNIHGYELPAQRAGSSIQRMFSPVEVSEEVEPNLRGILDAEIQMQRLTSGMNVTRRKSKEEIMREMRRTP